MITVNSKQLAANTVRALSSARFFQLIVGLLIVQALWIALTGRYPMAFDEDFHLGIIRLYANHLSPFWSGQPPDANAFGAVARDPSYLYHYLMSFPYRLIRLFTNDQTIQVIFLRLLNIGLFASCLPLYRRLLLKTGASRALVHSCLALFILVPITPLLAAQINYDNLILPVTALLLLLTVRFRGSLQPRAIDSFTLLQIAVVGCFGSLVKYAFLPIFLAVLAFLAWQLVRTQGAKNIWPVLLKDFRASWARPAAKFLLVVLAMLLILGFERYGINILRYHTPVPDCGQVLSVKQCSAYGPWGRDYLLGLAKHTTESPLHYVKEWLYGMWFRCFFAVDGPSTLFETRGPLLIPALSAVLLVVVSVVAVVGWGRNLRNDKRATVLALFGLVSGFYVAVLFAQQYQMYSQTGMPVAINGRYILPVLPLLLVLSGLALRAALKRRTVLKSAVTVVAILSFAWGGGALTYILRSNTTWYWSSPAVRHANQAVQKTLGPITPGNSNQNAFLR
ncbi:MAG: hypothetical protein JWN38_225 [Candidatus Saccharibacteria bacterium]|nr:hypothetical protein [Candidatus Saccharibacteria bacterium]